LPAAKPPLLDLILKSSVFNWYGEDANKRLWIPAVAGMAALRAGNSPSRGDGAFDAGDAARLRYHRRY